MYSCFAAVKTSRNFEQQELPALSKIEWRIKKKPFQDKLLVSMS
jgi:hypothetical protein